MEAAGRLVRWHVDDFGAAVGALPALERGSLVAVAERLRAAGLTFELIDGGRRILTVGSTTPSLVGRIALGHSRIRPRRLWRWAQISRAARRVR